MRIRNNKNSDSPAPPAPPPGGGSQGIGVTATVAAASLDHTALSVNSVASSPLKAWENLPNAKGEKTRLLRVQHGVSEVKSLRFCQRVTVPNTLPLYRDGGIKNIIHCSNSYCISCGVSKEAKNTAMVIDVIENTKDKYDYYLTTLTIPTGISASTQIKWIKGTYKRFISAFRNRLKKHFIKPEITWGIDQTIDADRKTVHFHKHAIIRVPKGSISQEDLASVTFQNWARALKKETGRSASSKAFYLKPLEGLSGVRYLFKSVREVLANNSKKLAFRDRLSWYGLLKAIADGRDDLVEIYNKILKAVAGFHMFGISKGMKADWMKLEEAKLEQAQEELGAEHQGEEEQRITPIEGTPQIHQAICDSEALYPLMWVLDELKDGDWQVESFRFLVQKWKKKLHPKNADPEPLRQATEDFLAWRIAVESGS